MKSFKVALLQMYQTNDTLENLKKGIEVCQKAKLLGADLALFPEMWSNGYYIPENETELETWIEQAIDQKSNYFLSFKDLARELNMAIALTYLEKGKNLPRNSISIIDRTGTTILTYSKVHTCDFSNERYIAPGKDFPVCELDTETGKVKLGAMICYDREFPECARILMLQGTEIILVPNACEMEHNRTAQLRTRAFENMAGIALANYAGDTCGGHSMAFDGMAFTAAVDDEDGESRDMLMLEADEQEGILIAEFDLTALRSYRRRETWGNAYRKPDNYSLLVSSDVKDPFIRKNSRR